MKLRKSDITINENHVREYHSINLRNSTATDIAITMDDLKIFQSILSRELPSERYDGYINLSYILLYSNATSEEIKSSLVMSNLWRINCALFRNSKMHLAKMMNQTVFLFNLFSELFVWNWCGYNKNVIPREVFNFKYILEIQIEYLFLTIFFQLIDFSQWNSKHAQKTLDASDCPSHTSQLSEELDKLKTMIDIRPKVIEDFTTIRETFPCNSAAQICLKRFVSRFNSLANIERIF